MDAYKRYHQVKMATIDEDKIAFLTEKGTFCHTKMPFRLRNAGETYHRLVDKVFAKQVGRNVDVYVDDMVIKSKSDDDFLTDVEETLRRLRQTNMKLNPKKCIFGVQKGKFLCHIITKTWIEANPEKVESVLKTKTKRIVKEVQSLNGKLATLGRFLAKSADQTIPFFQTWKTFTWRKDILWSDEAEEAI